MPRYYEGEPDEESRQYYQTVRIQDHQRRFGGDLDFNQLVRAFRIYGLMYDEGHRLRDVYYGFFESAA